MQEHDDNQRAPKWFALGILAIYTAAAVIVGIALGIRIGVQ